MDPAPLSHVIAAEGFLVNQAPAGRTFKFSRASRIKEPWEFEKNRVEGARFVLAGLIANWRENPQQSRPRLGIVTSKKIGGAVVRSRVRRRLREIFRLHQHEIKPVDLILIARPSIANKTMSQVEKNCLALWKQTGLLVS